MVPKNQRTVGGEGEPNTITRDLPKKIDLDSPKNIATRDLLYLK